MPMQNMMLINLELFISMRLNHPEHNFQIENLVIWESSFGQKQKKKNEMVSGMGVWSIGIIRMFGEMFNITIYGFMCGLMDIFVFAKNTCLQR